ncbi:cell envelope biogenesis protein OmpA [Flagellimonas aquimarina]|uniref:Cell envelope biogenesis protein OmpA n=1 Tax=Flagellimonas aquimarina TaxID=2201895 RepID=A0A316KYN9_9FLAO|nr:OmpA family protein [Allomuricauda koreensis]PWL37945.1 cell envelope biogenesis protein OmpA [Allomuricauda koreensis]
MKKAKNISTTLLGYFLGIAFCFAQSKSSKGDDYFFQYDYKNAISAYELDLKNGTLSEQQFLNLADAYFKTNNFEKASDAYLSLYKKDTLMSNHHFNKMMQSLSKTTKKERKQAFLATMSSSFQKEFLENLEFNTQLLEDSNTNGGMDFQIFNLNGNSPQSDFSPSFYGGQLLFSSGRLQDTKRRYVPANEGYLNIYEAGLQSNGQISTAIPFSGITSSNYHKATPYYSQALRSIFYVLSNSEDGELSFDENGKNALAIGMQVKDGRFQLLLKDLSTSFYYPFYDEKTERLYFAANFDDGFGGTDIYFVHTNRGQIMSAPINLGPRINSAGNEIAPYIFEDSFYFSSDVFYGLGGMDIYRSNIDGGTFSIPINLGMGINSSDDDFGLIMRNDGDGLLGYFSSNRPGGKGKDDLYGFKVDKKPGLKTIALKGKVVKHVKKSKFVDKAAVRLWDINGNMLAETYTDDEGNYRLEIPWEKELVLESSKERYSMFTKRFTEKELDGEESINYDISISSYDDLVEEKEGQAVVKLEKFFFGRSASQLTPEIETELDKVVLFVRDFPSVQLRIETYTDSRGGSSTNFRLTQSRSDAIKKYLIQNGVPSSNIIYSIGYGEDKILNNCTNGVFCLEVLHKQNQRSMIVILNDNVLFD